MAAEAMWRRLAEILGHAESRMHAATARSGDGWQGGGGDAFLVDDSGAFEVDLPYTDPVIGELDPSRDAR